MSNNEIDDRIRAALHARADLVTQADLAPAAAPQGHRRTTIRWAAPLLAAAAVAAVAIGVAVVATQPSAERRQPVGVSPTTTRSSSSNPPPARSSTTASATSVPSKPYVRNCYFADLGCKFVFRASYYVPLWPFDNAQQARQWESVGQPNGHSPWHSEAPATALFFTENYLGFTDLTEITSRAISAYEAHIGVGFKDPNGQLHTAAVIHLVRYGDTKAGWEVVGSDDTTFSLETPAYDSTVSSPIALGGRITGVDENIHVWVRTSSGVLANRCCTPAGGDHSPWQVTVSFPPHQGPITLVASTGGHLIEHERFAIQGVMANS